MLCSLWEIALADVPLFACYQIKNTFKVLGFEVKSLKYRKWNPFTVTVDIFSQIESQRESVDKRNNTAFEKDLRHARNDTQINGAE